MNASFDATAATGFLSGRVAHCRFQPRVHKFNYPFSSFWLALDKLDQARQEQPNWFSPGWGLMKFRRQDHVGPQDQDLADYIRQLANLEKIQDNQVYYLGQLRYGWSYFSPVNFFFIGSAGKEGFNFHTMVAEVSNMPWNERHHYIVPLTNTRETFQHPKTFHVSPFMDTQQEYHWQITYDDSEMAIAIHSTQNKLRQFTAALNLKPQSLNHSRLLSVLVGNGVMIAGIKLRIYWQALKLFCKGISYKPYPGRTGNQNTTSQFDIAEDKDGHRSLQ